MFVGFGANALVGPVVWGPRFENTPAIFRIAVLAAAISLPITLVLVTFFSFAPWTPAYLAMQFGYVMIISLIMTTAGFIYAGYQESRAPVSEDRNPKANFLERLPVKYRTADLHAISSEDHYLRVHTSLGEEMILMRLADAVRELASVDGLQVHRSWWIAKSGVTDEKRVDGRSLLILPSGTEVPVSRSYRGKAKDAGLIR
ncbi:MAG: LytTR family DNA-binding domain-containing protein [Henriciella sp.]